MAKGSSISSSMKKGIRACEIILGIKYSGKTFDEAKKFLEENLPKIKGKDIRDYLEPSEKMYKGIGFITQMLGVEFKGSTMKEASDFISDNMSKAVSVQKGKSKNAK